MGFSIAGWRVAAKVVLEFLTARSGQELPRRLRAGYPVIMETTFEFSVVLSKSEFLPWLKNMLDSQIRKEISEP